MHILFLEMSKSEESVLQDILNLLSGRTDIQLIELSGVTDCRSSPEPSILSYGDLEIHMREQIVCKRDTPIPMSHYEFFTLCYLARHPGWVFSKQQIYEAVWQEPEGDGSSAIANIVSRIRKKLNPDNPKDGYIKTVVNGGYKFEV